MKRDIRIDVSTKKQKSNCLIVPCAGVYGDVHRVKILFNKKDNALIQMADPHQAGLAITFLDKVRIWGRNIRVAQSRHGVVQMPKEGQGVSIILHIKCKGIIYSFSRI